MKRNAQRAEVLPFPAQPKPTRQRKRGQRAEIIPLAERVTFGLTTDEPEDSCLLPSRFLRGISSPYLVALVYGHEACGLSAGDIAICDRDLLPAPDDVVFIKGQTGVFSQRACAVLPGQEVVAVVVHLIHTLKPTGLRQRQGGMR